MLKILYQKVDTMLEKRTLEASTERSLKIKDLQEEDLKRIETQELSFAHNMRRL